MTDEDAVSGELARLLLEAFVHGNPPDYVFLENVHRYQKSQSVQQIRDALDDVGLYHKEYIFWHADYGVPQLRRRWHLLAGPQLPVPWPEPTHSKKPNLFESKPWVTFGNIRQRNITSPTFMSAKALKGIIRRQRSKTQKGIEKNHGVHTCLYVVEDTDMMYTMMASAWKGLSRNQSVVVFDDYRYREPTELEWQRTQGFPDTSIFLGTKRQRYEQIGRAVPPPMAGAVALAIVADKKGSL